MYAIAEAKETIWISDSSTYWLFFIYPIIAAAVARGVLVKVLVQDPPPKNAVVETKRRASLTSLGCDVVLVSTLAFTGLVVDYPGTASIAVISSESGVVGKDFEYNEEQVRLYHSQLDLPVIRNLGDALTVQIEKGNNVPANISSLYIVSVQPAELFS